MIFAIGLRIVSRGATLDRRNLTIIATSIVLGVGVEVQSDALANLPSDVQILATSGIIVGGVTALVLNAVLPTDYGDVAERPVGESVAEQEPGSAGED